jgi:DNA-binding winged helix-turn-helix (wHTH) protein
VTEALGQARKPKRLYRFGEFSVSCAQRRLSYRGDDVPLIPRYFDLLVLLLERRHEAVSRRDIMDVVWSDVVVSDGALTQAIRTLRRALFDDPREPAFIRTVSRHGYQFVHGGVIEIEDGAQPAAPTAAASQSSAVSSPVVSTPATIPGPRRAATLGPAPAVTLDRPEPLLAGPHAVVPGPTTSVPRAPDEPDGVAAPDAFEEALAILLRRGNGRFAEDGEAERREAAEALHALGTAEALRRLDRRPGHEAARALLRDARWDVAGAGPVRLVGEPGAVKAAALLVLLRLRRAVRLAGARWTAASAGGAVAGLVGGVFGGLALCLAPGSTASASVAIALAMVGAAVGGLGAAGVGAGLAAAEALARSARPLALVALGGAGGGALGAVAHHVGRWTLEGVFGRELGPVGGGFEGLVLGAAAGLGYALSTPTPGGGMASPHGRARLLAALATGVGCLLAGLMLPAMGGQLAGASLNSMARSFQGSQVGLAPLARLMGERELGPLTRSVIGGYEGLLFGFGLALGLTRRPR